MANENERELKNFTLFRAVVEPAPDGNVEFEIADKDLAWKYHVLAYGTKAAIAQDLRNIAAWLEGKK